MSIKVIRSGSDLMIALPSETIARLGIEEGSRLEVVDDPDRGGVLVTPVAEPLVIDDSGFDSLVDEFIDDYRNALESLAQR